MFRTTISAWAAWAACACVATAAPIEPVHAQSHPQAVGPHRAFPGPAAPRAGGNPAGPHWATGPSHVAPAPWHGNIGRFHDNDLHVWRDGRWSHQHHDGRLGWWWITGGTWYYYPAPVYPYPNPYIPPPYTANAYGDNGYWYYCPPYEQYYPYVSRCPDPWLRVPATP